MTAAVTKPAKQDGRGTACCHIAVIAERRYLKHAQPAGLVASLRRQEHEVEVVDSEAAIHELHQGRWMHGLDLAIARGRSWGVLCLLAWAAARGVRTINRRECIARVHNKAEMAAALACAGVPMPRTYVGTARLLLQKLHDSELPLIVKPVFGDNGCGLRLIASRDDLASLPSDEALLAQQYLPNDGTDLKLYAIGDRLWAVRKRSPFAAGGPKWSAAPIEAQEQPEILVPTAAHARIAEACRRLFELELFGVDCVETPSGPVVIEVNEFPNYTGVPDANDLLADYVVRRAREEKLS